MASRQLRLGERQTASGVPIDTGVLYCNDNLDRLIALPAESVDLIYLDPPFFSNRIYEVIWGDEAEVRSFQDRWEGGIQHYLGWMKPRVAEMYRVLKPTGSFYLHSDWHAGHYLKVLLDDIFDYRNFQNEFVWYYSGGGASKRRWARKHDTIFFYTKSQEWTFNADAVRTEYKWTRGQKRADQSERDLKKGKLADDVWEHHSIMPWAQERLGWPTQKPEALLERLIVASSNPGDVVLDPFCGCGTTVAVAERLNREWIGIDISPTAIEVMRRRLWNQAHCVPTIVDTPDSVEGLKDLKPFEFQNWIINAVNGTQSPKKVGDMGIDGRWFFTRDPIQVKQSEHVGRNVVDNFETAIRRDGSESGYIIAFSFTKGAHEEVARVKAEEGLSIRLVKVSEVLIRMRRPGNDLSVLGPQPEGDVLPLPAMRKPEDLPSAEDLVASDLKAAGA